MSEKPSYLGLLNAIAVAEGRAETYLRVWADTTRDEAVRKVLLRVAAREGEHAKSFAKRINELGYEVREKRDDRADRAVEIVTSSCTDVEKFEALQLHELDRGAEPDIFDDFFKDHSIDVATGELLGRYIAEERDTARLLRQCHAELKTASSAAWPPTAAPADDRIGILERKLDALCDAVEALTASLGAADTSNGARMKERKKG